ncbi:hypothetical protein Pcinc_005602 [Petrolisthes cinctipes]|uniref:FAD dependent oxidoreductase domain-containing protein n=1 Tax=Petrolisthes cinctipes TaxID=88211 RepID=A0AAE1GD05_PETCI|nr:hypothetical protein Pcinc_005602 [Petrolisthes cinctipes]
MGVKVCVVGGGVVGLTTATLLQEHGALPVGSTVTLLADKFLQETTSDGVVGVFLPSSDFRGPTTAVTKQWIQDSHRYYTEIIANTPEAQCIGVKKIPSYFFSNHTPSVLYWSDILKEILEDYRMCTKDELKRHGRKYGVFATTLIAECSYYLPYLTSRFTSRGGVVERRHLKSLEELVGHYDVVCNCSGLGARDLVGDHYVFPIRGHLFKVHAPWITQCYMHEFETYIIPGKEYVTLGSTKQFDSYNTTVCHHDSCAVWDHCMKFLPSLKGAKVLWQWVGLRPWRPYVRVEKETMVFKGGKTLKVVHNYGHGSGGVTSSPGTAMHAITLIKQLLQEKKD